MIAHDDHSIPGGKISHAGVNDLQITEIAVVSATTSNDTSAIGTLTCHDEFLPIAHTLGANSVGERA
jgi:hypothetical protein